MMAQHIADPVAQLHALLPPAGGRTVVGLVGLPGAGKSTQARRWTEQVNALAQAPVMQCVGMDGFHYSRAELAQLPAPQNDLARRGAPWTFDATRLAISLQALRVRDYAGRHSEVHWPDFDHAVGEPVAGAICIAASTRLVLVEGLYLLLPDAPWGLSPLLDHTWFLDEDLDTAMHRLVTRHRQSWGLSEAEARARIARNDRLNAGIADQTRRYAQARVTPTPIHP